MECEIEYTDEFESWWDDLNESEQEDVAATVQLLEAKGPQLPFPYSSGINGSNQPYARTESSAQRKSLSCLIRI